MGTAPVTQFPLLRFSPSLHPLHPHVKDIATDPACSRRASAPGFARHGCFATGLSPAFMLRSIAGSFEHVSAQRNAGEPPLRPPIRSSGNGMRALAGARDRAPAPD